MKFLAWCTAWSFYGIGHFISRVFLRFDSLSMILYPIYNKLMVVSSDISDKYGLDVWMSRQERLNRLVDELQEMIEEDDDISIPFIVEMLLKDHDAVYVAMVAKQLQQQLWDQVNLGLEVGDTIGEIAAAVGNRTPGVIFMNPRNMIMGSDVVYETPNVLEEAAKKLSLKRDMVRYGEPGIVDKSITPTIENSFSELQPCSLMDRDSIKELIKGSLPEAYDKPSPILSENDIETVLSVSPDDPVTFKIGRAYRHSGGGEIFIVGKVETTVYGNGLVAEEPSGRIYQVGSDAAAAVNWEMIPLSEWMKNFS